MVLHSSKFPPFIYTRRPAIMWKMRFSTSFMWKLLSALCLAVVLLYACVIFGGNNRVALLFPSGIGRVRSLANVHALTNKRGSDNRSAVSGRGSTQSESHNACAVTPSWSNRMLNPELTSDLSNWEFTVREQCPTMTINSSNQVNRDKVEFNCHGNVPRMFTSSTTSSSNVTAVPFGDECLLKVINTCCTDEHVVPNVLHYVWYGKKEMGYFQFLSFMSGVRFMKPCLILIHGEHLPFGPYWEYFIRLSPNVVHVQRARIETVYGKRLSFPEHGADVMRIEAIQKYGGLYLDFDEILLQPIQPLRRYQMTMGRVLKDTLGNQFILAQQNASFLDLWHNSYKDYRQGHWSWNSLIVPYKLSVERPDLIHIDGYNFTRPSYLQTKLIFDENYDWSTNYAMHLFIRWYKRPIDVDIIRTLKTTIGAVSRHVLFGNKELCGV